MTRRGGRGRHRCEVAGCGAARLYWQAVCDACWARLPQDQRAAIDRARKSGNIGIWSGLVRTARYWLEQHAPAVLAARRTGSAD